MRIERKHTHNMSKKEIDMETDFSLSEFASSIS
nr:MAG TPA: hypothetical protein [Caudoviricetes sp.]